SLFCRAPPRREPYTLSLHDALPIFAGAEQTVQQRHGSTSLAFADQFAFLAARSRTRCPDQGSEAADRYPTQRRRGGPRSDRTRRSEEHTSELQSRENLVCRLLLEKK